MRQLLCDIQRHPVGGGALFARRLPAAALALAGLVASGCAARPCTPLDGDRLGQLVAQLEGRCCSYHTEPVEGHIDTSCKPLDPASAGLRLWSGERACVKWAADCLGELGEAAAPAVPALVAAAAHGPGNYDTGDGVIPTRDAILRALGRTRDPRAVAPLLAALATPRGIDAGPGALAAEPPGPAGQVAAAEALGLVGPAAAAAVPALVALLGEPADDPDRVRRCEAVAGALGHIGDLAAVPALAAALADPAKAVAAARALGELGPGAAAAGPALLACVAADPDRSGNASIRRAVRAVLGDEAYRALPPSWDRVMGDMSRWLDRSAKQTGCQRLTLHNDGPDETLTQTLGGGWAVATHFPRQPWVATRQVAGTIRLERDGELLSSRPFASLDAWRELAEDALGAACAGR